jgi:hypothetical protein
MSYEFVECPYCKEQLTIIQHTHLKKHNKTTADLKKEFPDQPFRCLRLVEAAKRGSIAVGKNARLLKEIKCIHCLEKMEVPRNTSNTQACKSCLEKGLENPDGRTKPEADLHRQETLKKNYGQGVTNIAHISGVIEKRSRTNEKRYGGTGFASEQLAEKTRTTIKEMYGSENIMQTEEFKKLFIGSSNPMSKENINSVEPRQKVSEALKGKESKLKNKTYDEIFGKEKADQLKEDRSTYFRNKFQPKLEKLLEYYNFELVNEEYLGAHLKHNWRCKKCGTVILQIWNAIQQGFECPTCVPRFMGDSKSERQIREFLTELNVSFEIKVKNLIPPKEIDIFIPDKKVAIEHNGLYIHREQACGKSYHLKKTLECEKIGIRLIHIFEDEWVYKNEIVKNRLKYILKLSEGKRINARDCIIKEIPNTEKDLFLQKYHLQGTDIGSPIRLGAFFNDQLVSVMTFSPLNISKGSISKNDYWELSRFCSDYDYIIRGIAEKLLTYFKNNYKWIQILTYADRRWSNGSLYKQLGFKGGKQTSIDYWYSKGGLERISRFKLRKRPDEPKDIPEYVLRAKEKYFRIFGCGSLRFTLENENQ